MKICTICDEQKEVIEFLKDKSAKDGYRNQCKACLRVRNMESHDKRREGYNKAMRKFRATVKGVTQTSLSASKCRAKKEGLPHNLDLQYLRCLITQQEMRCALSGEEMIPLGGWSSPSLDKIIPELGYIKGNVQWLTQRVNLMKGNLAVEQFIKLCKTIAEGSETISKESTPKRVEAPNSES
jgi:hypothetical protein